MKTKLMLISFGVFMLTAMYSNAQQNNVSKSDSSNVAVKRGPNFVDNNKDGICDNRQSQKPAQTIKGKNFVDKDNDGICDNRQNKQNGYCCGKGKGNGNGRQYRHGWRNGNNK